MPRAVKDLREVKCENWPRLGVGLVTDTREPWPAIRADPELRALVDAYLRNWIPGPCPGCDWGLFTWGLVHGAGECSVCGWPGRLYHSVTDADGKEVVYFQALLWAHPYTVHRRQEVARV